LLPKYRGLHSTVWSILNNEPYFGLTIHIMNEFIDDGPVVYQYKFRNSGQNEFLTMSLTLKFILLLKTKVRQHGCVKEILMIV
jgi:methionyl-tRNA formyltransferase